MVVSPYSLTWLYIQIFKEMMSSSSTAIVSRYTGVLSQLSGFLVSDTSQNIVKECFSCVAKQHGWESWGFAGGDESMK